jgi:L-lactate dehydrogenase complex protein LldF
MRDNFRRRARRAIANHDLQVALDRNAERRMGAWEAVFASLPEVESLRRHAHEIRKHTIENLDHYLEHFTQRLEENGVQVHRAVDGDEACRLVVSIAKAHDARLVTKSKSMTTEEIGLNQALQKAGIRVVETDLGEFIVQLRGERPAHIITPAVHLRREDVAATFERELGMPYSTNVEDMTAAARAVLREEFLAAQIGVSGVNFGVAESGTLCLVTNEGNGRMVTTLPPVHIAVMGVERLVPTLGDLAVMLRLLPRSATGQKITSYVTLMQNPRQEGDAAGPDERHVIILDNNRMAMAGSPLAESLLCIRCGACLNACPVFREIGGHAYSSVYPGPIGSVVSPGLFGLAEFGHLAKASSLCGACAEVCPVGIDLPGLLLRVRHLYTQHRHQPVSTRWLMGLYTWLMLSPVRYRWAQKLAAWATRLLPSRDGWIGMLPTPFSNWTASRFFPPFSRQTFLTRKKRFPPVERQELPYQPPKAKAEVRAEKTSVEEVSVRFGRELEAIGGMFVRCELECAPDMVLKYVREIGVDRLLAWSEEDATLLAVSQRLQEKGYEIVKPQLPRGDDPSREETLVELSLVEVGLTGAVAGIAETGTVVVDASRRSQLASMLPKVHLVLLPASEIYETMEDWLAAGGEQAVRGTSSMSLISGPSRTADIEMTMTIGVHGPARVVVFCLE